MQRIAIFGATSAVAGQVAALYAARGDRLHLVGRDPDKLSALVAGLRAAHPGAPLSQEQTDLARLEQNPAVVARAIAALGGLDLALIAQGDLGDQLASEREWAEAERILVVNLHSVISLLIPLANHLEGQRRGALGVITSVAAERGRPRNFTYGAAKGALNTYLQGLRTRLWPAGVAVTTLKLGPVDSPMTISHAKHALFSTPAAAARGIVAALDARRPVAFVPGYWALLMPIVRHTPEAVFQRLAVLSAR
ncbi:SDR family NAD(P)-dependent oxidoreductase [Myxococcota bacterium]|nr:SDR family NAD(P)-dependent oxidoreductase [Myxococcota bacterium]